MKVDHKSEESDFSNVTSNNNYDNTENTTEVINAN